MCDKNCGSGGTDVCTCRCLQVTAYKSKGGTIFEKKEDCQKANEAFDKEQERKRQADIDNKATNAIYAVVGYNGHYRRYRGEYYNNYDGYYERGYSEALSSIKLNWRKLRSLLNAIQD